MSEQLEIIPLNVSAKGEVLSSNLAEFRASVKTVLDASNSPPKTMKNSDWLNKTSKCSRGSGRYC